MQSQDLKKKIEAVMIYFLSKIIMIHQAFKT